LIGDHKQIATMSHFLRTIGLSVRCYRRPTGNTAEAVMGAVMIKCPNTGTAIPTGIKSDRASFRRTPVFIARSYCPHCRLEHEWFAKEAWVEEPAARPHDEAA
jgi:hypothetical protein